MVLDRAGCERKDNERYCGDRDRRRIEYGQSSYIGIRFYTKYNTVRDIDDVPFVSHVPAKNGQMSRCPKRKLADFSVFM